MTGRCGLPGPGQLVLAGDIDEVSYAGLVAALTEVMGEIHLDLAAVPYCDLAGLRAFVLASAERHQRPDHPSCTTCPRTCRRCCGSSAGPPLPALSSRTSRILSPRWRTCALSCTGAPGAGAAALRRDQYSAVRLRRETTSARSLTGSHARTSRQMP